MRRSDPGRFRRTGQRCAGGAVARRYRRLRAVDGDLSGGRLDAERAGAAARPGPECRDAAGPPAPGAAARRDPLRTARARRAAARLPGARRAARRLARGRRRHVCAARVGGVPPVRAGLGDGGRLERRGRPAGRAASRRATAVRRGLRVRRPRPAQLPDARLALGHGRRRAHRDRRRPRRRARRGGDPAARGARRIPAPGARSGRRPGVGVRLRGVPVRPQPRAPRPARRGRDDGRRRGPGSGRPRRDRPAQSGMRVVPVPVDELGLDVAALSAHVRPGRRRDPGAPGADRGGARRRSADTRWSSGPTAWTGSSSRTTTTRSSATTGSRWARSRGWRRTGSIAMGSTSKTLSPTLRHGLAGLPAAPARARWASRSSSLGRGAPGLDQLALAALVESGRYDRHLRQMRGVYKSRREALVEALARYAPEVAVTGLAAGCHAVLRLPPGVTEEEAVAGCAASSVAVYGMSRYRSDRRTEPAELVLGFGNVKEQRHRRRDAPGGSGPARPTVCPVVAVTPFSQLLRHVR